jgi:methyltransferase-like protein 6
VCTMVFVLSAIAPERMPDAIRNVSSVMRTGGQGRVLLRDYAAGDLAQTRLGRATGESSGITFTSGATGPERITSRTVS